MNTDTKRKLVQVYVGECSMGTRPTRDGGICHDQTKIVPRESVHEYVAGELKKLADKGQSGIEVVIYPTADLAPAYAVKKGA